MEWLGCLRICLTTYQLSACFQSDLTMLHPHQQWRSVPVVPYPCQYLVLSVLGLVSHFNKCVVVSCGFNWVFLIMRDGECLFRSLLVIKMSSFVNSMFSYFIQFMIYHVSKGWSILKWGHPWFGISSGKKDLGNGVSSLSAMMGHHYPLHSTTLIVPSADKYREQQELFMMLLRECQLLWNKVSGFVWG
jgi:hypothetical protein